MSSTTPRMGLKTAGTATYFLTSDFQHNWSVLDTNPGVLYATYTATTKAVKVPNGWGSAQAGRMLMTSTYHYLWKWTGSAVQLVAYSSIASTTSTGVALINGTQTILSVTVPNDGRIHLVDFSVTKVITTALTGGNLHIAWNSPAYSPTYGTTGATTVGPHFMFPTSSGHLSAALPGTTITLSQNSAMTAGAAKVYAIIEVK